VAVYEVLLQQKILQPCLSKLIGKLSRLKLKTIKITKIKTRIVKKVNKTEGGRLNLNLSAVFEFVNF
jgi:hypothetical protein